MTDILVRSNRRCTDAYCQGQKSECVGGWGRLFSLLGYSSSGSIQMPKSSIVWPHSNNTIVPSGSDCATLCNAGVTAVCVCLSASCFGGIVCECSALLYGRVSVCLCVRECVCVCAYVCVALCVSSPSSMRLHFPKQGVFSAGDNNVAQSLKCSRANAAQTWPCFVELWPHTHHQEERKVV